MILGINLRAYTILRYSQIKFTFLKGNFIIKLFIDHLKLIDLYI